MSLFLAGLAAQTSFTVTNSTYRGPLRRPPQYNLSWHDEFSGRTLDARRWQYETHRNKAGWHNGELQYYSAGRARNLRVGDGLLTIELHRESLSSMPDWGGQKYSSARIISRQAWRYGFYEVRAKLPCTAGSWPAIWMLAKDLKEWPDDGEIDIMEHVGAEPHLIYASLHTKLFNHMLKTQLSAQRVVPTSCTAFHRYQLDWREDSITIGVDDQGILKVRNDRPGGKGAWPFDAPFQMILNLAMGGDWAGAKGIDDAALPQRFLIDYVRIWTPPTTGVGASGARPERGGR